MISGRHVRAAVVGGTLCLLPMGLPGTQAWAQTTADVTLDTVVVTGRLDGEERSKSTATVWVIDEEKIKKTNAASITDLLASSSVGFFQ